MFKFARQYRKLAGGCVVVGALTLSAPQRKQSSPAVAFCENNHVEAPLARVSPAATATSWASYVSPVAWYQWGTLSYDDYHFNQYISTTTLTGLMSWPSLGTGLAQRVKDEALTRQKIQDAQQVLATRKDMDALERKNMISDLQSELTSIMYGAGVTTEQRQEHLALYGCALYTDESLSTIADSTKDRGVVEMGAGNGQWARQLKERHNTNIVAFDSMNSVPLPFLPGTTPSQSREESRKYFGEVMQGDERIFHPPDKAAARGLTGRALMIVFPDQGPMAMECLKSYVSSSPSNDLFIYVGEGRGGANGDEALFDWLESGEWTLERALPLKPFGSKGFERFFVFRRNAENA